MVSAFDGSSVVFGLICVRLDFGTRVCFQDGGWAGAAGKRGRKLTLAALSLLPDREAGRQPRVGDRDKERDCVYLSLPCFQGRNCCPTRPLGSTESG